MHVAPRVVTHYFLAAEDNEMCFEVVVDNSARLATTRITERRSVLMSAARVRR